MREEIGLGRRQFTIATALAALSGVAITVSGCGGGDGGASPAGATGSDAYGGGAAASGGEKVGSVSANHGHAAVITAAQLRGTDALVLNIRGNSDHSHTVALSAAELGSIAAGQQVSKESTTESAHGHTVTFN